MSLFRLSCHTVAVVNSVRPSEVVDNADGWSLLTALDWVTVAVGDDNDNFTDYRYQINYHIQLTSEKFLNKTA